MLPHMSSSHSLSSVTVSGLTTVLLGLPTKFSKSTVDEKFWVSEPLTAKAERSSILCESRRNWLCSFSTRSPSLRMTDINRWNCSTLSTSGFREMIFSLFRQHYLHGPMDMDHNWGRTRVATASRSTLNPIASCTDNVAIWKRVHSHVRGSHRDELAITAGSFVRILESKGTSFCVRLA